MAQEGAGRTGRMSGHGFVPSSMACSKICSAMPYHIIMGRIFSRIFCPWNRHPRPALAESRGTRERTNFHPNFFHSNFCCGGGGGPGNFAISCPMSVGEFRTLYLDLYRHHHHRQVGSGGRGGRSSSRNIAVTSSQFFLCLDQ